MFISNGPLNGEDRLGKKVLSNHVAKTLAISEILKHMPHRSPFLMIDRVTDYKEGDYLHAVKLLTVNEPFFQSIKNGRIVMPDMLVLETIAQAAGLLALLTKNSHTCKDRLFYLMGIKDTHFHGAAMPGDKLHVKVDLVYTRRGVWCFRGTVSNETTDIASAEVVGAQEGNSKPTKKNEAETNTVKLCALTT